MLSPKNEPLSLLPVQGGIGSFLSAPHKSPWCAQLAEVMTLRRETEKACCAGICHAGAQQSSPSTWSHLPFSSIFWVIKSWIKKLLSKTLHNQRSLLSQLFASCFSFWKSYIPFQNRGQSTAHWHPNAPVQGTCKTPLQSPQAGRCPGRKEGRKGVICHSLHPLDAQLISSWADPDFASAKGQVPHKHSEGDLAPKGVFGTILPWKT